MTDAPKGRWKRALDMAKVGARAGAAWAAQRGADAAAQKSAEVLGNLRGLAAKVGQTLSYVDGIIPADQREVYEAALKTLQRATPPSSYDSVRTVLREDLGDVERWFASFDESPAASASIGQVHRAVLHDGTHVAVKVQHLGIDEAVESDLKNIGMFEQVVNLAGPKGLNAGQVFDEVMCRLRAELDYRLEARNQLAFAGLHAGTPGIGIPRVFSDLVSRRVLVTEWIDGLSMDEAVALPEDVRAKFASTMWRFVFRGNLVGGAFNADPHPGNYIFHPDGSVHFLDFGCVQPLPEHLRRVAISAHRAALAGDMDGFDRAIAEMLGTRGGTFGEATRVYTRELFQPLLTPSFRMTRAYAGSLVQSAQRMKKAMLAKDGSFVGPPPQLALMNRLQFGFYSVLAMLDVEVSYQAVEHAFLSEALASERGALALE